MMYTTGASIAVSIASGGMPTMRSDDQGNMIDLVLNAQNLNA